MKIKGITEEDFVNYKKPSMFIATATCSFKCDKEYGQNICQNSDLTRQPTHAVSNIDLSERYINNPITKAIVFGGLEPFDDIKELLWLISEFRSRTQDDIVIYTGYTKEELKEKIIDFTPEESGGFPPVSLFDGIKFFKNIIVKYGRYIPNQQPHFDPVLGVYLASDNQYAERIS